MPHHSFQRLIILSLLCVSVISAENRCVHTAGPEGGEILCIAHHGDIIYAGTFRNGVFRFYDATNSWITVNGEDMKENITSLHATDDYPFAGEHSGPIYRSDDCGEQWTEVNTQEMAADYLFGGSAVRINGQWSFMA
jgi:hypothetical protein